MELWRTDLRKSNNVRVADLLADPKEHPHLFGGFEASLLAAEKGVKNASKLKSQSSTLYLSEKTTLNADFASLLNANGAEETNGGAEEELHTGKADQLHLNGNGRSHMKAPIDGGLEAPVVQSGEVNDNDMHGFNLNDEME